ncbi:hypothetical protein AM469_006120 [Pseudomonas aeruginosa]|nr:hypothetical protein AM469_006120 [Pseudomonas aeruginosa]
MDKGHHKNQGENAQDSGTVQTASVYADPVMKTLKERQMTLAANLKKISGRRGLTQQQVYEAAGVSKSSYTGYEAGHGMPSADKALAMAKVLGVTTDELLMDESELLISDDMRPIIAEIRSPTGGDQESSTDSPERSAVRVRARGPSLVRPPHDRAVKWGCNSTPTPPGAVRAPKATRREGPARTRRAKPLNIPRRSDRPMCASTACSMDGRDTHAWVIRARGGFGAAGTTKPAKGLRRG